MDIWFSFVTLWILSMAMVMAAKSGENDQEVSTARSRPKFLDGFFSGYIEANLLTGTVAGFIMVYDAGLARDGSYLLFMLGTVVLLQGPAIAERSLWKSLATIPITFFILMVFPMLYGRHLCIWGFTSLPITLWSAHRILLAQGGGAVDWELPALTSFAILWLWVGMTMTLLQDTASGLGIFRRFIATIVSVAAGSLLALVLFRMSWGTKLSESLAEPFFWDKKTIISLFAYGILFAIVPCVIQYCCVRLLRTKLCSSRSSQKMD